MTLTVNGKEYTVKFGLEATSRSCILSEMANAERQEMTIENVEKIALTIADVLLVGLQNKHSDEFGYDIVTGEGKDEALSKVCKLIDEYTDEEDNDIFLLYASLQEEMMRNGFIKSLFQNMQKAMEQTETTKKTTKKKAPTK